MEEPVFDEDMFDAPFLDHLQELIGKLQENTVCWLVITWDDKKKDYEPHWIEGKQFSVEFTPELLERALIYVHTHPSFLNRSATNIPPTHMDIRQKLMDIYYFGQDAPNYYVLDRNGVYRIHGLTPEKKLQKEKDFLVFLETVQSNTTRYCLEVMRNTLTLPEYLSEMKKLGIDIEYTPYSQIRVNGKALEHLPI